MIQKPKIFTNAENKAALMRDLEQLRFNLIELNNAPNDDRVYDWGVKFFNIITKFQDTHNISDDTIACFKTNNLSAVLGHIKAAGHGDMCRTQPGEPVTLDNLYLGNVFGIWTKPARVFKKQQNIDVQHKIQPQLRNFVNSHRDPLIQLLTAIKMQERMPNRIMTMFANNNVKKK